MSMQVIGIIISAVIALIGIILSFTNETGKGRRFAVGMTTLFTIVALFMGLEQYVRTKSM